MTRAQSRAGHDLERATTQIGEAEALKEGEVELVVLLNDWGTATWTVTAVSGLESRCHDWTTAVRLSR